MKSCVLLRGVLFSTAAIFGLAMCGAVASLRLASAASPAASASASASSSTQASDSANAPVGPPKREPIIEQLEKQTIPTTASPVPKLEEWKNATKVDVERGSHVASQCDLFLVREWLKVKCNLNVGAIYQHSGKSEGVAFWIRPKPDLWSNAAAMEEANGGEMIFPLRVGDRRLLQFYTLRHDSCVGTAHEPSVMVDETWIEGESAPTMVLR
jgi:hypothetical protein